MTTEITRVRAALAAAKDISERCMLRYLTEYPNLSASQRACFAAEQRVRRAEIDKLQQQCNWLARQSAWAWPSEPAYTH